MKSRSTGRFLKSHAVCASGFAGPLLLRCVAVLALLVMTRPGHSRPLAIAANTAGDSFDPVTGVIYQELRSRLKNDFPGTTFASLPEVGGDLSGFDLLILNRYSSQDLQPAEQAAVYHYVLQGGSLVYVGEVIGVGGTAGPSNDPFTQALGIFMTPDPATEVELIAYASYSNPEHPFLTGPFGTPSRRPSGSYAAQVSTLGPSVELARWEGGGVAIAAFQRDELAPGAGFGLFLTDVNMITPGRYSREVGPVLSNALSILPLVLPLVLPTLGISWVPGGVQLSWDERAVGWTLQVSDSLASWSDLGPVITGSGFHTDTSGLQRRFFRFKK